MNRAKKTNNIFNKPILPQSLFYEEIQKDYMIDGVKVQGCWLKSSPAPIYRANIKSSIQLAELRAQFEQLKQNAMSNPTDMFRMAEIKKKLENFDLMEQSPKKKNITQNWSIKAENLTLQKISPLWGTFERKCKLYGKQLMVFSEKEKQEKSILLHNYTITLEQKDSKIKESQQFIWPQDRPVRLFLHGPNLRAYCVYGDQHTLRNIVKKMKIQAIQVKQIDIFKTLAKQYDQKVLIIFGNKLRIYEHLLKRRQNNDLQIAFQLLEKSHLLDQFQEEPKQPKKQEKEFNNMLEQGSQIRSQSSAKTGIKNVSKQASQILSTPLSSPLRSPINDSQFRMRARRSTINYEDLDNEEEIYDFKVGDFTLEIKQVTHSDEEGQKQEKLFTQKQQELSKIINTQARQQLKKKNTENKKFMQELTIHQNVDEYSVSDSGSSKEPHFFVLTDQLNKNKSQVLIQDQSPFQLKQVRLTHHVYIAYFESFFPYSSNQIEFTFFQKATPEIEYENMKLQVCALQKLNFEMDPETNYYFPKAPILFQVSKFGESLGLFFNNNVKQIKQQFEIDLKKILYPIDQSQLLYFKIDERIQCAGKLKIIISPEPIQPKNWVEQTTQQFLASWIAQKENNRQQKYKFIDYKKRHLEICQKWSNKMIKRIINRSDQKQFQKAIFYGLPPKILQKINNCLKNTRTMSRSQTKIETKSSGTNTTITSQCFTMLECQLIKMKVYDLRVFIKMDQLVSLITQGRKNPHLQKRIDDICAFFSLKYGKPEVQKFIAAYVLQTLRKVQSLLLTLKNAKQIELFFNQYFDVEYQIDNIMESVSAYFN